jgi:hypothetical protein
MSFVFIVIAIFLFIWGTNIFFLIVVEVAKDQGFLKCFGSVCVCIILSTVLITGSIVMGYWGYNNFIHPMIEWIAYADASGK